MTGKTGSGLGCFRADFTRFLRENRGVLWAAALSAALSYGALLANSRIGIDSEANVNDPDFLMISWYTVSRYSLVWLKDLTGMREFSPFAENFLMMIVMILCGVGSSFLFYTFSGGSRRMRGFCLLFPVLYLTHPCQVQQYAFTLQAFEVAVCLLSVLAAAYGISRWAFGDGGKWLAGGLILLVFGFGGYQALVPLYMAAALGAYLIYYEFHRETERFFYLRAAVRHVIAFGAGYGLYVLVGKAVAFWQFGPGFQAGYLAEQLHWNSHPVWECIGYIKSYVRTVVLGEGPYYGRAFLFCALLFAVRLLYVWVRERRQAYVLYAAAALAMVLSPFYLSFYQGGGMLMRSQLCLPFTAAFFCACVPVLLTGNGEAKAEANAGKDADKGKSTQETPEAGFQSRKKSLRAGAVCAVFALLLLVGFRQGLVSSRAAFAAQLTYELDRATAEQIVTEMRALGASGKGQHIAMLGQFSPELRGYQDLRSETIGYSIFEWDYWGPVGVSRRGAGFMQAHGFPYEPATEEEYAVALAAGQGMSSWPAAGSVQLVGDVVVVKFSD